MWLTPFSGRNAVQWRTPAQRLGVGRTGRLCSTTETRQRRVPGHWNSLNAQKEFLGEVARKHGVREASEWNNVSTEDVQAMGGGGLLKKHGGSLAALLQDALGEEFVSRHGAPSRNSAYWEDRENRASFLKKLAEKHNVTKLEDWKTVTKKQVKRLRGGDSFLRWHRGSLWIALAQCFPEQEEEVWRLTVGAPSAPVARVGDSAPQKADRELSGLKKWFWGMQKNRVDFLRKYAAERAILSPAQWREVTLRDISEAGGRGLIDYHASSMWRILGDLYDEGTVGKVLQGRRVAKGHWEDVSNVRTFLEDVASRLEIETPEDWRAVRLEEVVELGGAGMLKQYKDSLFSALEHAYGDEIQAFLCRPSIPKRFWQSSDNVRAFLLHARDELEISSKEDWDRVSRAQLLSVKGGYGLLSVMTLPEAVRFAFPEEDWPVPGLPHTKKAAQRHLLLTVQKLLPGVDFIEDYHHSVLAGSERGGGTKRSLELDIFSSALRLAFGVHFPFLSSTCATDILQSIMANSTTKSWLSSGL